MVEQSEQDALLGKIAAYTELLHKDPQSTIFVPLCDAYRELGQLTDALDIVRRGILENPAYPSGYVAYGQVLEQQGRVEDAVAELEKALILDRNHFAALKALAQVRITQADYEAARTLLEKARSIRVDDPSVVRLLEELDRPVVEPPAAVQLNNDVEADSPPVGRSKTGAPISTATIAEIYIRQGFPGKALRVYRDLLRADPQNEQLRQKLVSLKETLTDVEREDDLLVTISAEPAVTTAPELLAETAVAVIQSDPGEAAAAPSLMELWSGWLDAIARRRELHVR